MEPHAIDKAVLSLSPPGVAFGDQALADHLARLVNEGTASTITSHGERFAGRAVLTLRRVRAAASDEPPYRPPIRDHPVWVFDAIHPDIAR